MQKHALLYGHCISDSHADYDPQEARWEDEDERFVEVHQFNAVAGDPYGPQYADLLRLAEQVGCHASHQREEAKEHDYADG